MGAHLHSSLGNSKEELEAFRRSIQLELSYKSSLIVDKSRSLLSIKYASKRMELRDLKEKKMLFRR